MLNSSSRQVCEAAAEFEILQPPSVCETNDKCEKTTANISIKSKQNVLTTKEDSFVGSSAFSPMEPGDPLKRLLLDSADYIAYIQFQ
jgi:hypothetical protein